MADHRHTTWCGSDYDWTGGNKAEIGQAANRSSVGVVVGTTDEGSIDLDTGVVLTKVQKK